MKIAIWHNLPSGGGKRALYDHVRGLAGRGHEIRAWCPSTADTGFLPLGNIVQEQVLPFGPSPDLAAPIEWVLRMASADATALRDISAMMAHAALFAEEVNRGGFDVVFANSCRLFHTPFAGRFLRVPCVLYLQEPHRGLHEAWPLLPWIAEEESRYSWWHPRTVRRWLGEAARGYPIRVQGREEAANIRAFDRVLVNSLFSRESVLRALGVDPVVCYLGIDGSRFSNTDGPREPFALSVGEFAMHKDPQFIVRSIAASRSRPTLVWVANRVDQAYLGSTRALADRLGVRLEMHVGVSEAELESYYRRASMFLYAPHLEPFGFAPLEAGACGTPVVAVAEGGVRETVVHMKTGLFVDKEPESMGEAIDHLTGNAALAREMGQTAAAHVRDIWTLESATARLEAHLVAVASGG